jgi:hypothetical protein
VAFAPGSVVDCRAARVSPSACGNTGLVRIRPGTVSRRVKVIASNRPAIADAICGSLHASRLIEACDPSIPITYKTMLVNDQAA